MKDFNWESFKKHKIAVHCSSEGKAEDFLEECNKRGISWGVGIPSTSKTYYNDFKRKTCYEYSENAFGKGLFYCNMEYFIKHNYEIIEWEI